MLDNDQVCKLLGSLPSVDFEWGWHEQPDGSKKYFLLIPLPQPIGDLHKVILEFDINQPFEVYPTSDWQRFLLDERCEGVGIMRTAIVLALTSDSKYNIEEALFEVLRAFIEPFEKVKTDD